MLMDRLSSNAQTPASRDSQAISHDQLKRWFQGSVELGCLPLARTLHLLLLRSVDNDSEREDLAEELSNNYITEKEHTQHLVDGVWNRTIDSYNKEELSELIRALLIHDKQELASSLYRGLSIHDPSGRLRRAMEWPIRHIETPNDFGKNTEDATQLEHIAALISDNNHAISQNILREGSSYLYFQAGLVHPLLLEPNQAYDQQGQLDFNHPAVDAPSMQWDNNLPEAATWLNHLDDIINTAKANNTQFTTTSGQTWSHWPNGINHPKSITVRLGLTSSADQSWTSTHADWDKDTIRRVQDYSASNIVAQLMHELQAMKDKSGMNDESAFQFACDVAYGFSRNKQCDVIDLGADNLLHLRTILQMPEPIQFAIIDGNPEDLVQAVRGTSRSIYPQPLPFIFEDEIMHEICQRWHTLNNILKDAIPEERLKTIQLS